MSALPLVATAVGDEDQARADFYALLAALLLHAPSQTLLAALSAADALPATQEGTRLDLAWEQLVLAATLSDATAIATEFDALFVSVGTPQLNPYGSRYLAGFLMEKPLAALRDDLHALGLARTEGSRELEDHLGALCEVMRLLIAGTDTLPARGIAEQKTFFMRHIAPWHARCLADIRAAAAASFYGKVAEVAQAFLDIEFDAFDIDDGPLDPFVSALHEEHHHG